MSGNKQINTTTSIRGDEVFDNVTGTTSGTKRALDTKLVDITTTESGDDVALDVKLIGEATDKISQSEATIATLIEIRCIRNDQHEFQKKILMYMEIITGVEV